MPVVPESQLEAAQAEAAKLRQAITDALKAMDEGRYGDARRFLKSGQDKPLLTLTGVIAKDGA